MDITNLIEATDVETVVRLSPEVPFCLWEEHCIITIFFESKSFEMVRALLENNPDFDVNHVHGLCSTLQWACVHKRCDLVRYLLKHPRIIFNNDDPNLSPIIISVLYKDVETIKIITGDKRFDWNSKMKFARFGGYTIVESLCFSNFSFVSIDLITNVPGFSYSYFTETAIKILCNRYLLGDGVLKNVISMIIRSGNDKILSDYNFDYIYADALLSMDGEMMEIIKCIKSHEARIKKGLTVEYADLFTLLALTVDGYFTPTEHVRFFEIIKKIKISELLQIIAIRKSRSNKNFIKSKDVDVSIIKWIGCDE